MSKSIKSSILFVFPVNTNLRRGDSTHVKEFISNIKPICKDAKFITYDNFNKESKFFKIFYFRIAVLKAILTNKYKLIYFRYYPTFFIEVFFLFIFRQKYFIELNAVIVDEMVDLKRGISFRILQYLDEFFFTKTAEQLICVTPEIANYYSFISRNKPIVVNNGANTDIFNPEKVDDSEILKEYKNIFTIGFVGSLSPWQDFETLVRAISELKKRGYDKKIICLIIGSGIQENFINNLINKLELDDIIKMIGSVPYIEVPSYINNFSLTVAPLRGSRLNKTGSAAIKVFEYMAMNKRVIITRVGHLSEIIESNDFGKSYEAENYHQLANIIEDEFLMKRKNDFKKSRQYIIDNYSWKNKINTLKSIFDKY